MRVNPRIVIRHRKNNLETYEVLDGEYCHCVIDLRALLTREELRDREVLVEFFHPGDETLTKTFRKYYNGIRCYDNNSQGLVLLLAISIFIVSGFIGHWYFQ